MIGVIISIASVTKNSTPINPKPAVFNSLFIIHVNKKVLNVVIKGTIYFAYILRLVLLFGFFSFCSEPFMIPIMEINIITDPISSHKPPFPKKSKKLIMLITNRVIYNLRLFPDFRDFINNKIEVAQIKNEIMVETQ